MNIVNTLDQINEDYIFFGEPIKNTIMNDGSFIRIMYSTPLFVLNGIYILISISNPYIEKYYNKYKCSFDMSTHKDIIHRLLMLEDCILKKVNIRNKVAVHKLAEQLKNGNIKFFSDSLEKIDTSNYVLKISGVWETTENYGITYKFLKL